MVGDEFSTSPVLSLELSKIDVALDDFVKFTNRLNLDSREVLCVSAVWVLYVLQKHLQASATQNSEVSQQFDKELTDCKKEVEQFYVDELSKMIEALKSDGARQDLDACLMRINQNLYIRPQWFSKKALRDISALLLICENRCQAYSEQIYPDIIAYKREIDDRVLHFDIEGAKVLLHDPDRRNDFRVCPSYELDYYQVITEAQMDTLKYSDTFGFKFGCRILNMSGDETIRMMLEQQGLGEIVSSAIKDWKKPLIVFLDRILDLYARCIPRRMESVLLLKKYAWMKADTGLALLEMSLEIIYALKKRITRCESDLQARVLLNIYSPVIVTALMFGDFPNVARVLAVTKHMRVLEDSLNTISLDDLRGLRDCENSVFCQEMSFGMAIHVILEFGGGLRSLSPNDVADIIGKEDMVEVGGVFFG